MDGLIVKAMPASIWARGHVGTQKDRGVCWPVVGPVTHASGREAGMEVASLTDRGALLVRVDAPWWQINISHQPKPGKSLVLLVSFLFTTYPFRGPSIIWIVYSGLEITPVS